MDARGKDGRKRALRKALRSMQTVFSVPERDEFLAAIGRSAVPPPDGKVKPDPRDETETAVGPGGHPPPAAESDRPNADSDGGIEIESEDADV